MENTNNAENTDNPNNTDNTRDNNPNRINPNEILIEKINKMMKKAYWDKLKQDIESNNYDSTLLLLDEIKDRLCMLTPNRHDVHHEIHEKIDTKFIDQKIKHNAMEQMDIYNIIMFIIKKITDYGTLADEPWNEIWKTQIEVYFNRGETLAEIFPKFFKEAMHRIEKVESEMNAFKESEIYKEILRLRELKQEAEKK